ncbi:uncharacterized protein LOC103713645 [Phoenix dactylifera]|uniref:Uncharacterized protein LOC103713645 n=1 Tax=Phoenix dactylifera TaxID=42345 RepID=A0A8B8J802_PHODC|nr:uncharacterized protein LOC103713645 [Phoenix dactylifera]
MMSRPMVLFFLLLLLIITSHFEWKQQILSEVEANPSISQRKQHMLDKEELVKEKIILSQENSIRQLNMLVQSLQRQLLHCRGSNKTIHGTESSVTENVNEVEKQLILED